MSDEENRTFLLNSALFPPKGDNKAENEALEELLMGFRARIMQADGVAKCFVDRYEIMVHFRPSVTTLEEVARIVAEAVAWADGQDGYFPLKETKTPTASLKDTARDPDNKVIVGFNSYLTRYFLADDLTWDSVAFCAAVHGLVKELADTDGVMSIEVYRCQLVMEFDPEVTQYIYIEEHLRSVLEAALEGENPFFPYLDGSMLELTFALK